MLFLLCIVVIVGILLWFDVQKPKNFPPGPKWFPLIGVLPLLFHLRKCYKFFHLIWFHLYEKYGSVVGIRIGRTQLVIVSGRNAIREVYNNDAMNGRPRGFFYRIRTFDKSLGVVFSENEFWEIQRKFTIKALRQIGMSRSNMIERIEIECIEMINIFRKKSENNQMIEMQHAFDIPVLNTLWTLVAGYRFPYEDERLQMLMKMIHESFRVVDMTGGILSLFPLIRFIAPVSSGYQPLLNAYKPIWAFLSMVLHETHTNKKCDMRKSFIRSYLEELSKKSNGENVHESFSYEQLLSICLDFFQAGTETTSNTLSFGLMYMIHHKDVSDKVQAELDAVIGRQRFPNSKDRNHLPYVEAVLSEILRFSNVAPLGIAHRTTESSKLNKYTIPEDTVVLVSLYSLNMDKVYWKDPEIFRPERFLNSNGEYIQHAEQFFPFGLGKRRCMGENLAKTSLFLFFATFMHSFNMCIPDGAHLPNIQPNDGITLQPKPFQIRLQSRFSASQ